MVFQHKNRRAGIWTQVLSSSSTQKSWRWSLLCRSLQTSWKTWVIPKTQPNALQRQESSKEWLRAAEATAGTECAWPHSVHRRRPWGLATKGEQGNRVECFSFTQKQSLGGRWHEMERLIWTTPAWWQCRSRSVHVSGQPSSKFSRHSVPHLFSSSQVDFRITPDHKLRFPWALCVEERFC